MFVAHATDLFIKACLACTFCMLLVSIRKKFPCSASIKDSFCPLYLEQLEQPQRTSQQEATEVSQGGEAEDVPDMPTTSSSPEDPSTAVESAAGFNDLTTPPPMDLASAYQNIPRGCSNIILSNILAHNGDDESMDLLARFLTLQAYVFEGLKPLVDKETLLELINGWGKQTMDMIKTRSSERDNPPFGITPQATTRKKRENS